MKHIGYCPKCQTKVIEAKSLGMFDDFTFKCPACKNLLNIINVKFKQAPDGGEFDSKNKEEYNMNQEVKI